MAREHALAILAFTKMPFQLVQLAILPVILALMVMPALLVWHLLFRLSTPVVFVHAHPLCSITQLSTFARHATIDAPLVY